MYSNAFMCRTGSLIEVKSTLIRKGESFQLCLASPGVNPADTQTVLTDARDSESLWLACRLCPSNSESIPCRPTPSPLTSPPPLKSPLPALGKRTYWRRGFKRIWRVWCGRDRARRVVAGTGNVQMADLWPLKAGPAGRRHLWEAILWRERIFGVKTLSKHCLDGFSWCLIV